MCSYRFSVAVEFFIYFLLQLSRTFLFTAHYYTQLTTAAPALRLRKVVVHHHHPLWSILLITLLM